MTGCLVVMQPTVLPWAGYFNLMYHADDFIFHDDIQLEKRSWQTRNRLLFSGKPEWISVPILHLHEKQKISETQVLIDKRWKDKLNNTFLRCYERHLYKREAEEILTIFLDYEGISLAERNEASIRFIARALQLAPRFHRASELNIPGVRSDRLIAFCKHFSAVTYLSPLGSADYLEADGFVQRSSAQLLFQDYNPKTYSQTGRFELPFESHLSIVDVVANLGWEGTRKYIVEGQCNLEIIKKDRQIPVEIANT